VLWDVVVDTGFKTSVDVESWGVVNCGRTGAMSMPTCPIATMPTKMPISVMTAPVIVRFPRRGVLMKFGLKNRHLRLFGRER
jgi:hypothetical protein